MTYPVHASTLRWFLLSMCIALLSACAVSPQTRSQTAPAALRLEPAQGVLALKVTSNRSTVSTFFVKWTTLRVLNLETKQTTTLDDRSDSSAAHSLFVNPLPAGTYEIQAVGNQASGGMTITESAKADQVFPKFKVVAGQLTDLGVLVYGRRHYPVNSPQFRWGQVDSPYDRESVLRQLEPSLAQQLRSAPAQSWEEGAVLRARKSVYEATRQQTMRSLAPTFGSKGELMLGESFGQIAVRDPSGAWSWIQTPTALPIRAIHLARSGALYVGSDDGVLLMGKASSTDWQAIDLPVSDGSVIHIGNLPGSEELLVVLQTRDRFLGLSRGPGTSGAWREQFSRPRALYTRPAFDATGAVFSSAKGVVVATGGTESKMDLLSYGPSSSTWAVQALDESGSPSNWVQIPGGDLGRFRGIPLTGMYFSASQNGGVTWEKRGDLNWANGSLVFTSERVGFVIRTDSTPAFDPEKFELSIWRTDDTGRSWARVGPTPALHGNLVSLGGPDKLGYASFNGRFYASTDGGKTWKLERQLD
jgi:hypothetical protein